MTRTIVQVGIGGHLIGRSAFCSGVDSLPVVGDLQHLDAERLVRLQPTHVMVQRTEADVEPLLAKLAAQQGWTVVAHPIVSLDDVESLLERLPEAFPDVHIGPACDALRTRLREARRPVAAAATLRVLIVGGGPAPLAWGDDTYLGQLVAATGANNPIKGRVWRTLTLEDIARLDVDVLLVPSEGPDPDVSQLEVAVGADRIRILPFEGIEIPGPHLAQLAKPIRALLSGDAAYTGSP
jgi:ABC-type Fe3+-hydroxamate transport system substrate-binding protein